MNDMQRFWSKTSKGDGCWIWTGSLSEDGYGRFAFKGGNRLAHRIAWELTRGPIPEGNCVLHRCDTPACVNPDHLFLGTQHDNIADMVAKGRQNTARGSGSGRAKLTESAVTAIRQMYRNGCNQKELAALFGVSRGSISQIIVGRIWRHVA